MTGKVEKGGKPIQTIQQQLAEIALKGTKATEVGVYDEESGMCSIPIASMAKKWKGKVMITFSPLGFMTLRSCGIDKIEESKDGNSYSTEKYIDVLEWIYGGMDVSVKASNAIKVDNFIYVNCGGIKGKDLAFNNASIMSMRESELMEKLEFVVRQLKYFLSCIEKDGDGETKYILGGKVKLYLCAYQPFDILLFALQKVLGFSLEKKIIENKIPINQSTTDNSKKRIELSDEFDKDHIYSAFYKGFLERACKNPVLKDAKKWFKDHQWRFQLEACEVHRLYYEHVERLTKQGMHQKKIYEIRYLMSTLKETTEECMKAYRKGFFMWSRDLETYKSWITAWQSQKKPIIHEIYKKYIGQGTYEVYDMDWPAVEYEGELYSYYGLEKLMKEEEEKYQDEIENAREETVKNAESDIAKIDTEIKVKEEKLNKETEDAFKEIYEKFDELEHKKEQRKLNGGCDSYSSATCILSEDIKYDDLYIEYHGKLLNEEQLRAEFDDLVEYHREQSRKINRLYQQLYNIKKIAGDESRLTFDLSVSCIQLGLTIASVALMIIFPPSSIVVATVIGGAFALTSITLEVTKWRKEDSSKNWKSHVASMAIDVISVILVPVGAEIKALRIAKGFGKLEEAGAEATAKAVVQAEKPAAKAVVQAEKPAAKAVVQAEKPAAKTVVQADVEASKAVVEADMKVAKGFGKLEEAGAEATAKAVVKEEVEAAKAVVKEEVEAAKTVVQADVEAAKAAVNADVEAAKAVANADVAKAVVKEDVEAAKAVVEADMKVAKGLGKSGGVVTAEEIAEADINAAKAVVKEEVEAAKAVVKEEVEAAKAVVKEEVDAAKTVVQAEKPAAKAVVQAEKPAAKAVVQAEKPAAKTVVQADKEATKGLVKSGSEVITVTKPLEDIAKTGHKTIGEKFREYGERFRKGLEESKKTQKEIPLSERVLNAFGYEKENAELLKLFSKESKENIRFLSAEFLYVVDNSLINFNNAKSIVDGAAFVRESLIKKRLIK